MLLFYPCKSFFFFFNLLIPNSFQSLAFSSNSLETLELLMLARKHFFFIFLLGSEDNLCSVSNTNRRFKYCSSGVLGKQRERNFECAARAVIGRAEERMRRCVDFFVCVRDCASPGGLPLLAACSAVKVNNRQMMHCTEYRHFNFVNGPKCCELQVTNGLGDYC